MADDDEARPLHECVFSGDVRKLSSYLRTHDVTKKDKHGNTALHLAVMLGRKECVHLLLAHGAPVKVKNLAGWSPLAEAISYGDRQTISSLVRKLKQQAREQMEERRPNLIAALNHMGDFYMELKWDFQSWVPLVSRILPSDVCRINKRGSCIRLDTTLVDFNDMRWERGDVSFLFDGRRKPSQSLTVLDNKANLYQRLRYEETEVEIEDEVDILMSSDIMAAQMSTKSITFTRAQTGWIFREDKKEMVGSFNSEFYAINGMLLESRKRREHLSTEDLQKNKAIMESFTKGNTQGLDINGEPVRRTSLPPPPDCRVSWSDYIASEVGEHPPLGRESVTKETAKGFKATVAMSPDFPLTIDMLLNVLEVVAPFKHFSKLRDFVLMKLPPGFPVKIDIPILPTVTAKITFQEFTFRNDIKKDLFEVPAHYVEDPTRVAMDLSASSETRTTTSATLNSSNTNTKPDSNNDEVSSKPLFTGESILKALLTSPTSSKNFRYAFHNATSNKAATKDVVKPAPFVAIKSEPFDFGDQTNSISTSDLRKKFVSRTAGFVATPANMKQVNSFINKFGSELVSMNTLIKKDEKADKSATEDASKDVSVSVNGLGRTEKRQSQLPTTTTTVDNIIRVPKIVVRHFARDVFTSSVMIASRRDDATAMAAAESVESAVYGDGDFRDDHFYSDDDSDECIPSLNVEVELKEGDETYNAINIDCLGDNGEVKTPKRRAKGESNSLEDLRCAVCGRQFNFRKNMNKHLRHMHGVGRFACAVCPLEFEKRRDLIEHRDIHSESGTAGGGFKCETCGKVIHWYNHFVQHRKTHELGAPTTVEAKSKHACPTCDKGFRTAANLRVHVRTHTGERPYACSVCGVSFAQKRIQVDHMNKHTGARPYVCPACGATFANYITFNVHKRTRHTPADAFTCAPCGATFLWKSNLAAHMRSHARGKTTAPPHNGEALTHGGEEDGGLARDDGALSHGGAPTCAVRGKRCAAARGGLGRRRKRGQEVVGS